MIDEIFYAACEAVGEISVHFVGRIVGKTFNIEAKKARLIGELAILMTLVATIAFIAVTYS